MVKSELFGACYQDAHLWGNDYPSHVGPMIYHRNGAKSWGAGGVHSTPDWPSQSQGFLGNSWIKFGRGGRGQVSLPYGGYYIKLLLKTVWPLPLYRWEGRDIFVKCYEHVCVMLPPIQPQGFLRFSMSSMIDSCLCTVSVLLVFKEELQ